MAYLRPYTRSKSTVPGEGNLFYEKRRKRFQMIRSDELPPDKKDTSVNPSPRDPRQPFEYESLTEPPRTNLEKQKSRLLKGRGILLDDKRTLALAKSRSMSPYRTRPRAFDNPDVTERYIPQRATINNFFNPHSPSNLEKRVQPFGATMHSFYSPEKPDDFGHSIVRKAREESPTRPYISTYALHHTTSTNYREEVKKAEAETK